MLRRFDGSSPKNTQARFFLPLPLPRFHVDSKKGSLKFEVAKLRRFIFTSTKKSAPQCKNTDPTSILLQTRTNGSLLQDGGSVGLTNSSHFSGVRNLNCPILAVDTPLRSVFSAANTAPREVCRDANRRSNNPGSATCPGAETFVLLLMLFLARSDRKHMKA